MFRHGKVILVLLALGLIAFGNSLTKPFVWDEYCLIVDNPVMESGDLVQILTGPFPLGQGWDSTRSFIRYRPLTMLTFWVDYRLWGLNPLGYHLTNLLLHLVNGWLFCVLIFLLSGGWVLGAVLASLFLVHPVHSQAVAYIPSRGDLLAGVGSLVFLITHLAWRNRRQWASRYLVIEMLALTAALLSKENAIMAPFILWAYEITYGYMKHPAENTTARAAFRKEAIGIGSVVLAYLLMRALWFPVGNVQWRIPWELRMTVFGQTLTLYLKWFLFPWSLRFPVPYVLTFPRWIGIAWLLILEAAVVFIFWRRNRDPWVNGAQWGLCWFLFSLLPVSNLVFLGAPLFASNYLYFPSMGLFLLFGALIRAWVFHDEDWRQRRLWFAGILIVVGMGWIHQTRHMSRYWGDPKLLFQTGVEAGGSYANIGYDWLAFHSLERGNPHEALEFVQKGIEQNPRSKGFYIHMADAYDQIGNVEAAESACRVLMELDPANPWPYNKLAIIYLAKGAASQALEFTEQAIRLDPSFGEAYGNQARALWKLGERVRALSIMERAIALEPREAEYRILYGDYLMDAGQSCKAAVSYQASISLIPASSQVYTRMARAYVVCGKVGEALQAHEKAIRANPGDPYLYFNYGVTLGNLGRFSEAKIQWSKALEIDPQFEEARRYLDLAAELENRR